MATVCKGKTAKDADCKRKTTNKNGYCYHHQKQVSSPPATRFDRVKNKGPSATDEKGYIYIYSLLRDERETSSYWKIGRTAKTVEKRLSQWPGSRLKKAYAVKYNKLAERLIHVALDKQRIYRYEYENKQGAKRYHSVYKTTGKAVKDSQSRADDLKEGTWKLHGCDKHVEWFIGQWSDTRRTVEEIVRYVNNLE